MAGVPPALPSSDASHATARWLDVSVTALPGERFSWQACDASAACGDAELAGTTDVTGAPPLQPSPSSPCAAARQQQHWRLASVETAALRALPQPVWVCDARGRCLFGNAAFCRLAGCLPDAAAGRPWTQLLSRPAHPAAAAAVQQLEAAIATGQAASVEVPQGSESAKAEQHPGAAAAGTDGNGCVDWWGTVSVSPLEEPGGQDACGGGAPLLVCMLLGGPALPAAPSGQASGCSTAATVADSAPAVAAPPALAQLCNQALASTTEGVVITDPMQPGNPIVWANAAFERMTGYPASAVLGRSHSFLQGPDTDPVVLADIAAAMDEGRPVVAEILVYRSDASSFWCQVSITPIRDAATGRVSNFVAVQRDISQRKAVEAASHVREQALSNLNEGICICDASLKDCPVVYCNNAFLRITGYSRKEVIGRNCRFLQGPKTDPAAVQRLATALHEGREITVELLNYRKSGEEFYNMLSITPVRDSSGRLLSFIGVQSDITELVRRRQAEKELQEAKVAAETAAEAKSMFLASMSHEIRTPLNGMIAVAQLLLSSGLTPEQRELTDTILESGNTLLCILGDILDFSKIDHNSMVLESAPVELRDMVESSVEMVAGDAARKGLEVAYCLEPGVVGRRLMGDSIRIRQILSNLLSNAVKFTTVGEVVVSAWVETCPPFEPEDEAPAAAHVGSRQDPGSEERRRASVEARAAAAGRPRLHVTVRDTGIGIPQAAMPRLFQQFRQGDESMTRRYGGTGLGLAISRRLAQLMGGNVWAESVEGEGSTFHFTMALQWEGEALPESGAAPSGAAAAAAVVEGGVEPRPARGTGCSFESSLGAEDSLSASRRASESNDPAPRRRSCSSGWSGTEGSTAATGAATAAADGDCNTSGGHGAEEQRLLLQQHHEALLQRLAQRSVADGAAAGPTDPPALHLASLADAPDTPSVPSVGMSAFSAVSSSSMLASLGGSCRSLHTLGQGASGPAAMHAQQQVGAAPRAVPGPGAPRGSSSTRGSVETMPAGAPAVHQRGSGDSVRSCPERVSVEQGRSAGVPPPPPVDYRSSLFYAPSQPIRPAKPPSRPLGQRRRGEASVAPGHAARAGAAAQAHAPVEILQDKAAPTTPSSGPSTATGADVGAAPSLPASDVTAWASSTDCCGASSLSAPPSANGLARPGGGPAGPTSQGSAGEWQPTRGGSTADVMLRGRRVCIDIAHGPTAVQVAQSCRLLGMEVSVERCQLAAATAGAGDFCITTADKTLEAVRAGWRSRPLVVLGRREDLPANLQPLAALVSKPVRHARLLAALLKANAFSRSKQQAPLHLDPQLLTLLPERVLLNPLAANRRISLDNSALDRRRWELAAAAAAAADGAPAPVQDAPTGVASPASPAGAVPAQGGPMSPASCTAAAAGGMPALQLDAVSRHVDSGASGGWQPGLAVIHSDGSCESSQRSSLDVPSNASGSAGSSSGGASAAAPWAAHQLPQLAALHTSRQLGSLQPVLEHEEARTNGHTSTSPPPLNSPVPVSNTTHSSLAVPASAAAGSGSAPAAPAGRPLHILVAEDNLINQRVISKVLQRVVPAAVVEIVGNGAEALAAAHRSPFDLCLMDIHMPLMDGLEASRRLQAELPPERRPVVVALSADTLRELHQKCRDAGIREFICKPFRIEDVERVLTLVHEPQACADALA